jgi:hypothetical protein
MAAVFVAFSQLLVPDGALSRRRAELGSPLLSKRSARHLLPARTVGVPAWRSSWRTDRPRRRKKPRFEPLWEEKWRKLPKNRFGLAGR